VTYGASRSICSPHHLFLIDGPHRRGAAVTFRRQRSRAATWAVEGRKRLRGRRFLFPVVVSYCEERHTQTFERLKLYAIHPHWYENTCTVTTARQRFLRSLVVYVVSRSLLVAALFRSPRHLTLPPLWISYTPRTPLRLHRILWTTLTPPGTPSHHRRWTHL